jgi:tetratricopeptide (TPR) repeat protein
MPSGHRRLDVYVLICGHRYGYQPENDNPDRLSITQLEFRRAGESGIPRIALLHTSVPDIRLTDLLDPRRAELVRSFEAEVRRAVRPAEFSDLAGLIQGVSTGIQNELEKARKKRDTADPERVLNIVATLTGELDQKNRRIAELEGLLRAAVSRTVSMAEQPGAGPEAVRAAAALEAGDTRPAEAQLRSEERKKAAQTGDGDAGKAQRSEAAALARELGALAMGRDITTALAAFQRAARHEPDDTWTHFYLGDLHVLLGNLNAAIEEFRMGEALAAALAARDPANTQWQRDVAVSCSKLGSLAHGQTIEARREYLVRGREILARLKAQNRLHPNQNWISWFDDRIAALPGSGQSQAAGEASPPPVS